LISGIDSEDFIIGTFQSKFYLFYFNTPPSGF